VVPPAKFSGDVEIAGEVRAVGDVVAGNILLKTHRHTGVQGGGTSNGPVP
jgi:phage baseplate assembly protein gpV